MDLKTFAAQHPELLAEITQQAEAEATAALQPKLEETRATAKAEGAADVLAMVKIVAGEAAHVTLEGLVKAGATPQIVEALAPQFAATVQADPQNAEAEARAKILAGIEAAANKPVEGAAPAAQRQKSKLVAEAERRAAKA